MGASVFPVHDEIVEIDLESLRDALQHIDGAGFLAAFDLRQVGLGDAHRLGEVGDGETTVIPEGADPAVGFEKLDNQFMRPGFLARGYAADIMMFDPTCLTLGRKALVRDTPGGEERWQVRPEGVVRVLVNGETVVRDGALTAARPGRVLHVGNPPA